VELFEHKIANKNLSLRITNPEKWCVMADPNILLVDITSNLLSNSIKFCDDGGLIEIKVAVHDSETVCLKVIRVFLATFSAISGY
jgi:signal transduction histidine kinase